MKAVILAGGEGSRLGTLSHTIPKAMVPIGDRPILEHQVLLCKRYGITDILLLTGRLAEIIEEHFGDGSKFGVNISYYREPYPLGTTGGIKECEGLLTDDFLVLYGDVMMDMDLGRLVRFHREKRAAGTLVLHPNDHPHDSDLAEIDARGRITAFHPKPRPDGGWYSNLVNAALYVLSPALLQHVERGVKADWGRHIFPRIVSRERLFGYNTPEYIKDVGTPERLEEVTADHLSGKIARLNLENTRRAIFLDRDGVINRHVGLLHRPEQFELLPGVDQAIRLINASEHLAIVVTNQPVVARGLCEEEEVRTLHKKMETLLGHQRAKLDAIYFCPHHPDKGYPEENSAYKIPCDCRKPATGMLEQAARDFHIDLANSCIIGDTFRDIQTGINAGMPAYAVRTGDKYGDESVRPDGWFDTLDETVGYVLLDPFAAPVAKLVAVRADHGAPAVYAISGSTRSGKTLLASRLRRELQRNGQETLVIHLDDWLLPTDQRTAEMGVLERYRIDRLVDDIERILDGERVDLPGYSAATRRAGAGVTYQIGKAAAVIIEGVVALSHPRLRAMSDTTVFLEVDRKLLEARIRSFYRWKGLDESAIDALLEKRWKDEYSLLEEHGKRADIVIKPETR